MLDEETTRPGQWLVLVLRVSVSALTSIVVWVTRRAQNQCHKGSPREQVEKDINNPDSPRQSC